MVLGTLALSRATTEGLALWSRSDSSSKEMGGKVSVGRCASRCATMTGCRSFVILSFPSEKQEARSKRLE